MTSVTPEPARASDLKVRLAETIDRAIAGKELLSHPFYQRWQAGELTHDELSRYAVQYRVFESALPDVLRGVLTSLVDSGQDAASELVAHNLSDELGSPAPHLHLFDDFVAALPDADPETTPATRRLALRYRTMAKADPIAGLAALAAYETQASAIAATKGTGLRDWYGIEAAGTAFWDVHAEMELEHGEWAIEALVLVDAEPADVESAAREGADLWWAFLDERQAEFATL